MTQNRFHAKEEINFCPSFILCLSRPIRKLNITAITGRHFCSAKDVMTYNASSYTCQLVKVYAAGYIVVGNGQKKVQEKESSADVEGVLKGRMIS